MRRFIRLAAWGAILLAGLAAGPGPALGDSALTLYVNFVPDPQQPGLFDYSFRLVLDNHTGTWAPGQGYGGLVFGDVPESDAPSPLADFVLNPASVPVGPWTGLDQASGAHNGPIFSPVTDADLNPIIWTPQFVGDSLTWSGVSATGTCDLAFSTLFTTNNAVPAEFQQVVCPEPSALAEGLLAAALGLGYAARPRRRAGAGRPNPQG